MIRCDRILTVLTIAILMYSGIVTAQGYNPVINIQGLDKISSQSVSSAALGGTVFGLSNDPAVLFDNPAGLRSISKPVLSVSGCNYDFSRKQVQQYAPAKYQPLWSLYMEGLIGLIPPHDTSIVDTGAAVIPKYFDRITPGWKSTKNKSLPFNFSLAYPFNLLGYECVIAAGGGSYANLNHVYQNNNVFSPAINSQRPVPISYLTGSASLPVEWFQKVTERTGDLKRYGGAIAVKLDENFSAGVSIGFISGKSDDYERMTGRGHMTYYSNYFKVDSVNYSYTAIGSSDYSAAEFAFSASYTGKFFSAGISVKPPSEFTRKINTSASFDSSGSRRDSLLSGKEYITFPLRGSAGITMNLRPNLKVTIEYDLLPYSDLKYKNTDGIESKPWRDISGFKVGLEYIPLDWLTLRLGVREINEVFEPVGNPLEGDPVSGSAYSAGMGFRYNGITINAAYQYSKISYEDMLENTVYLNESIKQQVMLELQYEIPILF